uniref:F-box domain-containing protein n=1 Tax=Solanum lycopersicum TaxID=4081 RepID=A0A3Q7FHJ3_SOLLC
MTLNFNLFQLISVIPQVCRAWQWACSDQLLWKMLDSVLQSNFIRFPRKVICLNFCRGNIQTLIFHHNMHVNDNQLSFTAESITQIKKPYVFLQKKKYRSIRRAIRIWEDLESLDA